MKIEKFIIQTSNDIYKVVAEDAAVLYVRKEYFSSVDFENIHAGAEYDELQWNEFLDAGLATAVEIKATEYLARAEQCRFNLCQKLLKKGYEKKYINMALDYLEEKNYLNDGRFAASWLYARKINHVEGRNKLLAELQQRGIAKDVASGAVEDFFKTNDESEIALKAYKKFLKQGKTDEKLNAAMLNAGFSYRLIKEVKENFADFE